MDTENVNDSAEDYNDELDLPPEYCHYRDNGCEFADSCLNCPFSKCIYDEPRGRQRYTKRLRDQEIARLFTAKRKGIKELALMFGVSQRTVQRALKNSLSTLSPVSPSPLKGKGRDIKRGADAPLKHPVGQDALFKGEGEDGFSEGISTPQKLRFCGEPRIRPSATAPSQPSKGKGRDIKRGADAPLKHPVGQDAFFEGEGEDGFSEGISTPQKLRFCGEPRIRPSVTPSSQPSKGENKVRAGNE